MLGLRCMGQVGRGGVDRASSLWFNPTPSENKNTPALPQLLDAWISKLKKGAGVTPLVMKPLNQSVGF